MVYRGTSGNVIVNGHSTGDLPLTGGTLTGALTGTDLTMSTISATDANVGNLVVTGSGRFTNGIYGDVTGSATSVKGLSFDSLMTKTYTGVTVSGDSDPAGWLYFFKIPSTGAYSAPWHLTYKVTVTLGTLNSEEISIVHIDGSDGNF